MEFYVNAKCDKTAKFLNGIIPGILSQLNLDINKSFVTVVVDDIDGLEGSTLPINIPGDNVTGYLIVLKPNTFMEMAITLCHEFVHVRQYIRGYLIQLGEGYNLWSGKVFGPETHYLDQPWERDAFSRQELLLRRVLES